MTCLMNKISSRRNVSREPLFLFTTAAQLKALLNSYAAHATYPEAGGI